MQSKATTIDQYLAELPADRRDAIHKVREVILKNLDKDYEEGMQYGMIGYYVPHRRFPAGYHCDPRQPLPFAGLASQKNHLALYIMGVYGDSAERERFERAWFNTGKKLDMGKACIRFKKAEDLALDVIGETICRMPASQYIDQYQASRQSPPARSRKTAARKAPAKSGGEAKSKRKEPAKKTVAARKRGKTTRRKAKK